MCGVASETLTLQGMLYILIRTSGAYIGYENMDDNSDTTNSTEQRGGGSTETSPSPGLVSLLRAQKG